MCVLRVLCFRDTLNARVCVNDLVVGSTLLIRKANIMTTIITIVIAALSLSLSTYVALRNNRKSDDKDIADKVARDTRIDLKLEEISNYVKEIRDDNSELKRQFSEMNRQLVIVEQSVKSAHHRIDRMEGKEDI